MTIYLSQYNPEWLQLFELEREQIYNSSEGIFASEIAGIEHIGSTAIPGIYAKPVIDIMIGVKNLDRIDNAYRVSLHFYNYFGFDCC